MPLSFDLTYTSHGNGCGFLSADFMPIAALLKQLHSLFSIFLPTKLPLLLTPLTYFHVGKNQLAINSESVTAQSIDHYIKKNHQPFESSSSSFLGLNPFGIFGFFAVLSNTKTPPKTRQAANKTKPKATILPPNQIT